MLLALLKRAFHPRRAADDLGHRGIEHYVRGELAAAETCFREAALQATSDVTAWNNLAAALLRQKKFAAALPVAAHLVELDPGRVEAHLDLGTCYNRLGRNAEAIRCYERALELRPDYDKAHAQVINAYLDTCDWNAVERWREGFEAYRAEQPVERWAARVQPFTALTLFPVSTVREIAMERAERAARSVEQAGEAPELRRPRRANSRIRIGYLSADFHQHATVQLTYDLYANHDRSAFEVYAYSTGPDDGSAYRRRVETTCDRFIDVREASDARIAQRVRDDEIDILVDMKGYTEGGRIGVFARKPAPTQVSYLGYPGTSGARYMDYFVTDPVATPQGDESEFTERLAYLPDTYQSNHREHRDDAQHASRSELRLPERGFVYCSFNNMRKIDRTVFGVWMSILKRVPGSVLWLLEHDPRASDNLRAAAAAAEVDPRRLVFADLVPNPAHLARQKHADLFLDALVCNAHTGTSDALWAGLPVLTCPGAGFARRVAASLLHAAGVPELVARDVRDYEEIAVALAHDPQRLTALRRKIAEQRDTCALFDAPRYTRNLEDAFRRMSEMNLRGEPPQSFFV